MEETDSSDLVWPTQKQTSKQPQPPRSWFGFHWLPQWKGTVCNNNKKNMRHTKKQAMGPIHTETVFERTCIKDIADKDFKAAVINTF